MQVDRRPAGGAAVDDVEADHRHSEQQDGPPRHGPHDRLLGGELRPAGIARCQQPSAGKDGEHAHRAGGRGHRNGQRQVQPLAQRDVERPDDAAGAPRRVERGEHAAPVAMLDGDRLHVGAGVHRAEHQPVDGEPGEEEGPVRREADQQCGERAAGEPHLQGAGATDPTRPRIGQQAAGTGDDGHAEDDEGDHAVAHVVAVLELRQVGEQHREEQALREERRRGGQPRRAQRANRGHSARVSWSSVQVKFW